MGIQGQHATSLRPGDPRKRDDWAMGPEEGLRQRGASPGARWEAHAVKGAHSSEAEQEGPSQNLIPDS